MRNLSLSVLISFGNEVNLGWVEVFIKFFVLLCYPVPSPPRCHCQRSEGQWEEKGTQEMIQR